MAFDGSEWRENLPTNNDLANEIDDYMRDDKVAVRGRMAHEHQWPSSQTGTNEAGWHNFVSFNVQTAAPSLVYGTTTQKAVVWCKSSGQDVFITDSAGTDYMLLASGKGVSFVGGVYSATGTQGDLIIGTTGGTIKVLNASADNTILTSHSNTGDPTWEAAATLLATLVGIEDYGTSASSSTTKNLGDLKIAFGTVTVASGGTGQAVTNLDFASDSSYVVVGIQDVSGGSAATANAVRNSGSQFTMYHTGAGSRDIMWIAIGV
jgi:hypothetical protein